MTLLSEASFLVTPNGYKEDKLYAAIPTNGNGDMTVTRATTATRVNEAGLVELVPYNLLSRSEEFNNASWNKTQVNVTANALTAPNGTLTADFLIPTAVSSTHTISQAASGTATFTIFAKQGGYKRFRLLTNTSGNGYASFNLETGLVTTASGTYYVSSGIEDFGNGWYRCRLVLSGAEATFTVSMEDASGFSGAWTGDGTSGIYFWGAQVVEGSSALTYQKTVDRLDIPRIDYTGGGCPSILLEPLRTNIVLRSQEFDNASFVKNLSSVSANTTTAPDGTLTADTWTGDGTSGVHSLAQSVSATSGVKYTQSVFAKKGTNNFIQILGTTTIYDANSYANFDLENGVVGLSGASATATITDFGNGWYRCTMTATATATASGNGFSLWLITSATAGRVETNSLATSVHLWGAQLEAGAYPTSYIPTVASTVTRNADAISKTGISALIGQTEGVLFVESAALFNDLTNRQISLSDGTTNNRILIWYDFSSNNIRVSLVISNIFIFSINYSISDETQFAKIAVRYSNTLGYSLWVNGVNRNSNASTSIPSSIIRLGFDGGAGGSVFFAKVKQVQLYKTYLTDAEMASLTTL